MAKTTKRKATKVTDPTARAVFTLGGLVVMIALDHPDPVCRQTAIECSRRMAHRLASWSQVVRLAPAEAASVEHMLSYVSDSDAELAPAIRMKVAKVEVR
jgi:hypothetical protein